MGKGGALGEFEHLVVLALVRLGEGAYGLAVRQEIEPSGTSPLEPCATLDPLELKGFVRSSDSAPAPLRKQNIRPLMPTPSDGLT